MPREFVITSGEPIEFAAVIAAAVDVDPTLAVRRLPAGGIELCDEHGAPVLSVMAPLEVAVADDAARILGRTLASGERLYTDVYVPSVEPSGHGLAAVQALAGLVDGTVHARGE